MLLTVKKQIEETLEVKTPAYYKDYLGNHHYINEAGILVSVRRKSVTTWQPEDGKYYTEEIEGLLTNGKLCTKEEFDKAYCEMIEKIESAAFGYARFDRSGIINS